MFSRKSFTSQLTRRGEGVAHGLELADEIDELRAAQEGVVEEARHGVSNRQKGVGSGQQILLRIRSRAVVGGIGEVSEILRNDEASVAVPDQVGRGLLEDVRRHRWQAVPGLGELLTP